MKASKIVNTNAMAAADIFAPAPLIVVVVGCSRLVVVTLAVVEAVVGVVVEVVVVVGSSHSSHSLQG